MKKLEKEHGHLLNCQHEIESQYRDLHRRYEEQLPIVIDTADTIRNLQQANTQMKEYITMMDSMYSNVSDVPKDRY